MFLKRLHAALEHVANADDAQDFFVLDHREVTDAARRHQRQRLAERGLRGAANDRMRHQFVGAPVERLIAEPTERAGKIALRHDADQPAVNVGDQHGANVVGRHHRHGIAHRHVAPDRVDLYALTVENVLDLHCNSRPSRRLLTFRRLNKPVKHTGTLLNVA